MQDVIYDTEPEAMVPQSDVVAVRGPASLSNLGPGFDTLGCCIAEPADEVEAWRVAARGVHVVAAEDPPRVPMHPEQNTASVAAAAVLRELDVATGMALRIRKRIPMGSGIGGSAASAVAGAFAAAQLFADGFDKAELVDAVLEGEAVASGCRHGDNVLPALFGGLVLTDPATPERYRHVSLPEVLHVALLLPEVPILTKEARGLLPDAVSLRDAVRNAASLAFLVDALKSGDYETAGHCIMQDRLVEPVRARLVPCYEAVREAAVEAGAWGCALTGSGPAMFALAGDDAQARVVADAMREASLGAEIPAVSLATKVDPIGVRSVTV